MKNIIVPLDYSEASLNALDYAAGLAQSSGARIILFHAFHLPFPTVGMPFLYPDIDEFILEHKAKLDKIGNNIFIKHGVHVKSISRPSFVLDDLYLLFKQHKAALVVMGMREKSLEYKLFGSVTVSAIRESKFPVLMIPFPAKFSPIRKILFACEHSCLSPNNSLPVLKKIALRFKAKVQILHVEKFALIPESESACLVKTAPETELLFNGIQHEYRFLEGDNVVEGIESGITEYKPDIIAMVPRKLDFFDELFRRGHTDKIAYHTNVPLLTLPNPEIM